MNVPPPGQPTPTPGQPLPASGQPSPYEPTTPTGQPIYGQQYTTGQPVYTPQTPYASQTPYAPQQPAYAPQTPYTPSVAASVRWGPSSINLEPNVPAGLAYMVGNFSIIFLVTEKQNRFARFHIIQALLLGATFLVFEFAWLLLFVIDIYTSPPSLLGNGGQGMNLLLLLFGAVLVLYLIARVWGMFAGFKGNVVRLPVLGNLAERWSGGPLVPATA